MTTPEQKTREILTRLLKRTLAGEVNWQDAVAESGFMADGFGVQFPDSELVLSYHSPRTDPDHINIEVYRLGEDDLREPVASFDIEEGDPDWELVHALYREAERRVTGWDKVLGAIEAAVDHEGMVGIPPEKATSRPAAPGTR